MIVLRLVLESPISSAVARAQGTTFDAQSIPEGREVVPLGRRGMSQGYSFMAELLRMNCMSMWNEVTNKGYEKFFLSVENIHLLYTESTVAKKNLIWHSNRRQEIPLVGFNNKEHFENSLTMRL